MLQIKIVKSNECFKNKLTTIYRVFDKCDSSNAFLHKPLYIFIRLYSFGSVSQKYSIVWVISGGSEFMSQNGFIKSII